MAPSQPQLPLYPLSSASMHQAVPLTNVPLHPPPTTGGIAKLRECPKPAQLQGGPTLTLAYQHGANADLRTVYISLGVGGAEKAVFCRLHCYKSSNRACLSVFWCVSARASHWRQAVPAGVLARLKVIMRAWVGSYSLRGLRRVTFDRQ